MYSASTADRPSEDTCVDVSLCTWGGSRQIQLTEETATAVVHAVTDPRWSDFRAAGYCLKEKTAGGFLVRTQNKSLEIDILSNMTDLRRGTDTI